MAKRKYMVLNPREENDISTAINQARMCLMCVEVSPSEKENAITALYRAKDLMKTKAKSLETKNDG